MKIRTVFATLALFVAGSLYAAGFTWQYRGSKQYQSALVVWTDEGINSSNAKAELVDMRQNVLYALGNMCETPVTLDDLKGLCVKSGSGDTVCAEIVSNFGTFCFQHDVLYLQKRQGYCFSLLVNLDQGEKIAECAVTDVADVDVTSTDQTPLVVEDSDLVVRFQPDIEFTIAAAEGVSVEWSVDGGATWTAYALGAKAPAGEIQIRLTSAEDAVEVVTKTLSADYHAFDVTGNVYATGKAFDRFVLENGEVTQLEEGDTIICDAAHYNSGELWRTGPNISAFAAHLIIFRQEMDCGAGAGIPANGQVEIDFNAPVQKGVYLYGDIGESARVSGKGILYLGHSNNACTINDGVEISANVSFQSPAKTVTINGAVKITGAVDATYGLFKLADGAELTVAKLDDGKVVTDVAGKKVVYADGRYMLVSVVTVTPQPEAGSTAKVYQDGVEVTGSPVKVERDSAVDVVFTANSGYCFADFTFVKTNTVTAAEDPTVVDGPEAIRNLVTVKPHPAEYTTAKVYTNGVEVTINPIEVVSNATVDVVFMAAEGYCFEDHSTVQTNTVTATDDPTVVNGPTVVKIPSLKEDEVGKVEWEAETTVTVSTALKSGDKILDKGEYEYACEFYGITPKTEPTAADFKVVPKDAQIMPPAPVPPVGAVTTWDALTNTIATAAVGAEIAVGADITEEGGELVVPADKEVVIKLYGKTVTCGSVTVGGSLTVGDAEDLVGKIVATDGAKITSSGLVTLLGGPVRGTFTTQNAGLIFVVR